MNNDYEIVQELKEEEKQGRLSSSTKESSKNNASDQNLDYNCFKNFFENAPIYEYMVSPEGTILEINKTACTILGYKKEEIIGKNLTTIYAPESHEKMKVLLSKWKETGEIDNEEMVIETKQGEKRIVLLSTTSVRGADGAILYSLSVLKDVTEINKIYDELNKNLWLQNVKLQKLNDAKKTFLKTTSHELRTPMTSIKGYVQLLMKNTLGEINEEQRKSLDVILRNTNRLDQVIQNILDASTLDSGIMKFIPRKVNPRKLVEEITKTIEPFANKKEITIHVNLEKDLPDLMIDGERIKQVLMNLVDNAIKFSSNGSKIHIRARTEKEDVLFEVQDFGQGIPADKQGMIFESFYQVDSGDDRKFGGAGLSLTLSRGIVGLHGGKIWFESTEGTGSTFLFTLPIQPISDRENTELTDESVWQKILEKSVDLAVNSEPTNTTDEKALSSITELEKNTATPKEKEERYQALFNSSLEIIYLHDLKGNFIDANPIALKILGYSKEDLNLLNFSSLLDGGQIWKAMKTINEIKKYGYQKEPTEFRLKTKNGTFIDVETFGELLYRDGKPYAIQGIARNITEQKQAKQIVKESVERYRTLFENAPDFIIETDEKGNILAVNPMMAKSIGVSSETLIGKNIFDILPREIAEERAKIARTALKEMKNQESDDERGGRYFKNIYVPIIDTDGKRTVQLIARDVTSQKKAEATLKEREAQLSNAVKIAHLGAWEYDVTNDLFTFTDSFYAIFHTTAEQIGGYTMSSADYVKRFVHPEDASIVSLEVSNAIETDNPNFNRQIEHRIIYPGGEVGYISVRYFIVKDKKGKTIRTYGINQDITERKKAEEKIKIFSDAITSAFDCILLTDLKGNITFANESAITAFGYTSEEFLKLNITELDVDPTVAKIVMQDIAVKGRWSGEVTNIRKNKEKFPAILSAFVIKTDNGNSIGTMGIIKDITERKKIEKEIIESEEKLKQILDSSPDAITVTDLKGNIIECNQTASEMHGSPKAELIGKNASEFFSPKDRKKAKESLMKTLEVGSIKNVEYALVTKDGREFPAELSARLIRDASGNPQSFVSIVRDVTERKKAEEEIKSLARFPLENPYPVLRIKKDGEVIYSNKAGFQVLDFWKTTVGQEVPERWRNIIRKKFTSKNLKEEEEEVNDKIFSFVVSPVIDEGYVNLYGRDITERRKAEEALEKSQEKYRLITENTNDLIMITNLDKTFRYVSPSIISLGYTPDELIGQDSFILLHPEDKISITSMLKRLIIERYKPGTNSRFEYRLRDKLGMYHIYETAAKLVKDESGKHMILSTSRDITERKKAEEEIKKEKETAQQYLDIAGSLLLVLDTTGNISLVNRKGCEILDGTSDELIGLNWFDHFLPKEDIEKVKKIFVNMMRDVTEPPVEYVDNRITSKKGTEKWIRWHNTIIRNTEGTIIGTLSSGEDITEHKQIDKELRESKALVEAVVENVPLMVFLKEAIDLRFVIFNRAGEELLGHDRKDLLGKNNLDLFPPEQAANFMAKDREVLDGEVGMLDIPEEPILTSKKGQRLLHTRKVCIRGADGVTKFLLGISEDITERKQAEDALRESEQRLSDILFSMGDWVWEVDENGIYTWCSNASLDIFGRSNEEIIGKTPFDFMPPDEAKRVAAIFSEITAKKAPVKDLENWIIRKNGEIICLLTNGVPILDKEGNLKGYRGVDKDITKRKQAEEALHRSEEQYRLVTENASDVIWTMDLNLRFTYFSPSNEKLIGYTTEKALKLSLDKLLTPESMERALQTFTTEMPLKNSLEKDPSGSVTLELNEIRADGTIFPAEVRMCFLRDAHGNPIGILGITRDITTRKKAEKDLKESEEKYRTVVEQASDGIVIVQDLVIKYVNPRAFNILGYNLTGMIGTLMTDYVHPDELPKLVEYYNRRIAGKDTPSAYESVLVHKDGRTIDVELSGRTITYQEKPADMIMVHDITDRKKTEKELKEKINQLEQYKKITVDRELKMIELKKEINGFYKQLNQKPRYEEV